MRVRRSGGYRNLIVQAVFFVALVGCNALLGIKNADVEGANGAGGESGGQGGGQGGGDQGGGGESGGEGGGAGAVGVIGAEISVGKQTTCARLSDGTAHCWGDNGHGQLGLGHKETIGDTELPTSTKPLVFAGKITQIAAGSYHTCALLDDGTVHCWGKNQSGQLGLGHVDDVGGGVAGHETPLSAGPVDFGGKRAIQVVAGAEHTCALLEGGAARCWGDNSHGQLGYKNGAGGAGGGGAGGGGVGGGGGAGAPNQNVDLGGVVKKLAAGQHYNCALLTTGDVHCWGKNDYGQLGIGQVGPVGDGKTPAELGPVDLGGVIDVVAGYEHTCALHNDGVYCWGGNTYGQLGYVNAASGGAGVGGAGGAEAGGTCDSSDSNAPSPTGPVKLGGKALQIVVGFRYTCALLEDGTVRCWGLNNLGQLGYGTTSDVCAIGDDEGETPANKSGPVDVGVSKLIQIKAGYAHTCVLFESGDLRCWGVNKAGQLGLGNVDSIGDDELPSSRPAVRFASDASGAGG